MMRPTVIAFVLAATTGPALAQAVDGEILAGDPSPAHQAPPAPAAPPDDLAKAADAAADLASIPGDPADLARAADATAEVAALPPGEAPAASAAPAGKPSSDDIDLSSLGLDPGAAAFDDKLNIYGFADFGFGADRWSRDLGFIPNNTKTFMLGNLNLYLAKNLTPKARTLAEVRFTFLPNGSQNVDGSFVDDTATDLVNFSRPAQWGGIVIERAYVEYDLTEHLTIRGGHWLTPYGIWNTDHGSPVIIATNRPYIIGEQFFPEHQTGLDLFGSRNEGGFKVGYHLTATNGRGGAEAQSDQDNKFAFGGRLEVETPWGIKLGSSYYRGRYTGLATTAGAPAQTYLEAAYGGDAQYDRGPLHLQGEIIARERHYPAGERAAVAAGFAPDGRDLGFYALASYRTDQLWNVMPFFYYEVYEPADHTLFEQVFDSNLGLNFRPSPTLVLKAQVTYVDFSTGTGLLSNTTLWSYSAQASWVF